MPCQFPEHHRSAHHPAPFGVIAVLVAVALVLTEIGKHAAGIEHFLELAAAIAAAVVVLVLVLAVAVLLARRLPRREPQERPAVRSRGRLRHLPAAAWARVMWRSHCRNLGLARTDLHAKDRGVAKIRHLRARIVPTEHGIAATVRTIPGTGRAEFEKASDHFANVWRCARVQVVQERPKRLRVVGLRTDPLAEPYGPEGAPDGTFTACDLTRLYLGRDAFGQHRWLPLGRNVTGVTVAGLPGTGKSSLINSWLCQATGTAAVEFAIADGKGGGDYHAWEPRCWLYADDDLSATLALLEDLHAEMRRRLTLWPGELGRRNAWEAGPDADHPLIIWTLDECQTYLDLAQYKGDSTKETMARRCAALTAQVIRKSGAVMMTGILATQKPTGDSLPTASRDNCALSVAFGLKTIDGAIAALGESIRSYDSYSPVQLQAMPGVCSSTLPTGSDPFALLRVPEVSEDFAAQRAAQTAAVRHGPAAVPTLVPDKASV